MWISAVRQLLLTLRFLFLFGRRKLNNIRIFRVDLWNNGNLVQDVFLGEIKVPVKVLRNDSFQAW